MKNIILFVLMQGLLLGLFSSAGQAQVVRNLLKDQRANIQFPTFTLDQRRVLVEQSVQIFTKLNTNEPIKNQIHGNGPWNDQIINDVSANYAQMSTADLQLKLQTLFTGQFDGHLNFYFPKPYQCYASEFMFDFGVVQHGADQALAVKTFYNSPIYNLDGSLYDMSEMKKIALGDELVTWNGQTLPELVASLQQQHLYAVENFRLRRIGSDLTWQDHYLTPVPAQDTVTMQFKRADGSVYQVVLPWIVQVDKDCLGSTVPNHFPSKKQKPGRHDLNQGIDQGVAATIPHANDSKKASTRLSGKSANGITYVMAPGSSGYGWGYLDTHGKRYGYFRLSTFSPTVATLEGSTNNTNLIVHDFRRIWQILNNDPAVRGLIIDVRDNPGGDLVLSANMIRSFIDQPVMSTRYRLRNSDENLKIYERFVNGLGYAYDGEQLMDLQKVAGTSALFTDVFQVYPTSDALANAFQRLFYKPTAVFINSNCFSSCDNFSALMQDHQAATIVGEDDRSGGGGANVWDQASMLSAYGPFPGLKWDALAYDQNIRFPARQMTRLGNPANLVEDVGILPTVLVPASTDDLQQDSVRQYDQIATVLDSQDSGINVPVPDEPMPTQYLTVDKAQTLTFQGASIVDQSVAQGGVKIAGNDLQSRDFANSLFDNNMYTRISIPLQITNTSLSKIRMHVQMNMESCCNVIAIGYRSGNDLTYNKVYSGAVDEVYELPLPSTLPADGKIDPSLWISTSSGDPRGFFKITSLEIL